MIVLKNKYKIDSITNNLSSKRQTVRPDLSKYSDKHKSGKKAKLNCIGCTVLKQKVGVERGQWGKVERSI